MSGVHKDDPNVTFAFYFARAWFKLCASCLPRSPETLYEIQQMKECSGKTCTFFQVHTVRAKSVGQTHKALQAE